MGGAALLNRGEKERRDGVFKSFFEQRAWSRLSGIGIQREECSIIKRAGHMEIRGKAGVHGRLDNQTSIARFPSGYVHTGVRRWGISW